MKNNKPVFESFNAFVRFINEADDAPMDFTTFLSSNQSFLDADAKKGFEAAKISATKAILFNTSKKTLNGFIGDQLGNLDNMIKDAITANNEDKGNVQITENTTTEVKTIIYPALINGKVALTADVDEFDYDQYYTSNKKLDDSLVRGAFPDINDLLTTMNLSNIEALKFPEGVYSKGKYSNWKVYDKTDYIAFTGASDQQLIASIASGISVGYNWDAYSGQDSNIIPQLAFKNKTANKSLKKEDEKAYTTLVLYGIGEIVQGGGGTIPASFIKKDFTKETVIGTSEAYQVPIDGGDAMFAQGSATINTKNKVAIDKILTAALAPLAGKPESIVITGGASYEPDGQGPINKKLVVDRANAVKTYLETLYPELKGVITVKDKDFSKIQATDTPADYEKFRKVYLDIKGVLQGASYTEDKEIEYLVDGEIKSDSVEIIQYAISFEFDLPNDKDKVTMSDAD